MANLRELERTNWLERARDAKSDDFVLAALISAWRAAPLVALCELVDAASVRTARALDLVDQDEWLAAVKRQDPAELPAILASVQTNKSATARVRAEALQSLPLDPRVAPALLRASLRSHLHGRKMAPFWTIVFRCIHRQFHPGIAAALREYDEAGAGDYIKLDKLRQRLAGSAPETVDEPTGALIAALRKKLAVDETAAVAKSLDDFIHDIWAAPGNDGLREVFADWLGTDDPRAELIMLQLTRKRRGLDLEAQKREAALLKKHAKTWLGPLEPVIVKQLPMRFEGGFLYGCKVNGAALQRHPALAKHPAWSTVREYELDSIYDAACDPWLEHMIKLGAKRK